MKKIQGATNKKHTNKKHRLTIGLTLGILKATDEVSLKAKKALNPGLVIFLMIQSYTRIVNRIWV